MDFDLAIFTLGYMVQHLGSFLLIKRIQQKRSIQGLSTETQVFYLIGTIMRIFYIYDTRLLTFFLIWLELVISTFVSLYILYLFFKFRYSRFASIPNPFFSYYTIIPACLLLSFFFHPGTKNEYYFTIQMFVSMSMFIEACAMLPQIYISRKLGSIEMEVSRYIACMALARVVRIIFWITQYLQNAVFPYLILADIIHTVTVGDLMFLYFKEKKSDGVIIL